MNLRSFAFAGLLVLAAAHGCGSNPGTAPGGGAAGRAGTAGRGGLPSGDGGTVGPSSGTGGVLAIGGAGGSGTGGTTIVGNGAGGSGAGTGGVGGMASGGDGGGGGGASGGVDGSPSVMAIAYVMPVTPGTVSGTATFVMTSTGVRLNFDLMNCPEGAHPLFIHAGDACTNATTLGPHWGPTRGENIGSHGGQVECDKNLRSRREYIRKNLDPVTSWTIGDGAMSDLVGHPIVIQGLDGTGREGCGVIQLVTAGAGGAGGAGGRAGSGGRGGAAGAAGSAGTAGNAGAAGSAGTTGSAGRTGSAGAPGTGGSHGSGGSSGSGGAMGSGSGGASAGSGGSFGSGGSSASGGANAGGNSGSAGASGAAGTTGTAGTGGVGPRTAAAMVMPFDTGTISGTVSFVEVSNGVKVTYDVVNCPVGQHPTQIHAGSGCGTTAAQGDLWTRGVNIGPSGGEISCDDYQRGTLTYVRSNDDPDMRWTIGDGSVSDIVGHPLIIRALNALDRDACGIIARTGAASSP